jgi:hypothetical protein
VSRREVDLSRAITRVTDPVLPDDPAERAHIVEQDARLMAVILFAPWPRYVASLNHVGLTFQDGRTCGGQFRDEHGRYRQKAA